MEKQVLIGLMNVIKHTLQTLLKLSRWAGLVMVIAVAGCSTIDQREPGAELTTRSIDLTREPIDVWDRIRRGFAVPNLNSDLVDKWTAYYAAHPQSLQRMADRSGKYLYYIVDEINRRGLPTELALLPFVESAYNPNAYSRAHASGLWQFIPSTGTAFELEQTWWRDQRRDPVASTNSALDYLEYLFEYQGDWFLAFASYNWGEGSVKRAIAKNEAAGKPTDYLSLTMPSETANYVPKLQAIKNIIADPERYAVILPIVDNEPYFVTLKKDQDIDVVIAAQLAEMPLEEFKELNPSYNQGVILADLQPEILLPREKLATYLANLAQYQGDLSSWEKYLASDGESLSAIASQFNVPLETLRRANDLKRNQSSIAGTQLLIIPGPTVIESIAAADVRSPVRVYRVKRGDTLSSIARRNQTSVASLQSFNNLKSTRLRVGQRLRIPG